MRRAALVSLFAVALIVMGGVRSAWACTCIAGEPAGHYQAADAVFVGTVESAFDAHANDPIRSSMDRIDYTFDVESVQKGSVPQTVVVGSVAGGASCGFEFSPRVRYQVYATEDGDGFTTHLCSGTTSVGSPVYEPDGSHAPDEAIVWMAGPPLTPDPDRGKPLAGSVAGAMAAVLGGLVLRVSRRRVRAS